MLEFTDDVRGTIIGGDHIHVALVSPNGKIQSRSDVDTDREAIEWARSEKAKLLANTPQWLAGDIYGAGEWELRIYD